MRKKDGLAVLQCVKGGCERLHWDSTETPGQGDAREGNCGQLCPLRSLSLQDETKEGVYSASKWIKPKMLPSQWFMCKSILKYCRLDLYEVYFQFSVQLLECQKLTLCFQEMNP